MAVLSIAAALSAGKGVFDRAAILRQAHAAARARMAPSRTCRVGDRRNEQGAGYVPKHSYRVAFADALRWAWRDAKIIADEEAWQAAQPPLPADVADRIRELRDDAWHEPITGAGNARYSAILAQARDLEEAARAALS